MIRQRNRRQTTGCNGVGSPRVHSVTSRNIRKGIVRAKSPAQNMNCDSHGLRSHTATAYNLRRSLDGHHPPRMRGDGRTTSSPKHMRFLRQSRRLHPPAKRAPAQSFARRRVTFAAFLSLVALATAADPTTDYLKPSVSSKACMEVVGLISAKSESIGNEVACMQCDPARNVCPPGCQALVDDLYADCDGVTTPDGLYFDPDNSIEGEWSDKIKAEIKIATERCGCDGSVRLAPFGGAMVFQTTFIPSSLGLGVLTVIASWLAACLLLRH